MTEKKQIFNKINYDILKWIVIGLAGFAVIVLIFSAGINIGASKAGYSYRWAESYHKNFGGPRGGFIGDWRRGPFSPGDLIEGHGVFGEIIQIDDTGLIVKGRGDIEKVITITKDTIIKKGRETIKGGLNVGDQVTIIGSPNEQGQIEAKLIRSFNGGERMR